jgi:hypothetical protein
VDFILFRLRLRKNNTPDQKIDLMRYKNYNNIYNKNYIQGDLYRLAKITISVFSLLVIAILR